MRTIAERVNCRCCGGEYTQQSNWEMRICLGCRKGPGGDSCPNSDLHPMTPEKLDDLTDGDEYIGDAENREILIRIYEDNPVEDRGLHMVEEQMHSIKPEEDLTEISMEISEVFKENSGDRDE